VLFTAADAHMRDFHVVVPPDCVATFDDETKARADLRPSDALDLTRLALGVDPPLRSRR
jgi:nicotinamidase-related amidase